MKDFLISRVESIGHAFHGWAHVLRTQKNAWIHSVIATLVFAVCLWLQIPARDWALIILTTAFVFSAEFINTSIEAVVDLATEERHPLAKISKDVGAAAVLVAALAALVVGLLILAPPLWNKIVLLFAL
ncbi:MAG: diacylglycerol kinase family protein [Anaerolineales bacterium]